MTTRAGRPLRRSCRGRRSAGRRRAGRRARAAPIRSGRSAARRAGRLAAVGDLVDRARCRSSPNRTSSCHGRMSIRHGLRASSATARMTSSSRSRAYAACRLRVTSDASPAEIADGRHGRPRDHSRHRTTPFPRSSASHSPSHRVVRRESVPRWGQVLLPDGVEGMCRARMIRPARAGPAPLLTLTFAFQAPLAISRLRRATKASSASRTGGSSGGGTASARSRFQMALARWVAVCAPSACHVSKFRQSDTSGR